MPMAYSLLAHLYPFIKGSQEDIATLSLQYLLTQSDMMNRAFTKRLANLMSIQLDDTLKYKCQVSGTGDEKERPDLAGLNSDGKEEILCEMKFYATLTANQPVIYVERLKKENGKGLMFVCPVSRKTSLWSKLLELCEKSEVKEVSEFCVRVDGVALSIMTWTEIIELLKQVAISDDVSYAYDIAQLEGYCNRIDSDAFVPFTSSDLKAEVAKKEERYYQVVDEVTELLLSDKEHVTSKKGVKATAYRKGYTRSLYIDDFTITINYDRNLWQNPETVETPFWFSIRNKEWKQNEKIYEVLKQLPERKKSHFWNMIFIAAEPLQNATLSEVSEDIKNKILKLMNSIK